MLRFITHEIDEYQVHFGTDYNFPQEMRLRTVPEGPTEGRDPRSLFRWHRMRTDILISEAISVHKSSGTRSTRSDQACWRFDLLTEIAPLPTARHC